MANSCVSHDGNNLQVQFWNSEFFLYLIKLGQCMKIYFPFYKHLFQNYAYIFESCIRLYADKIFTVIYDWFNFSLCLKLSFPKLFFPSSALISKFLSFLVESSWMNHNSSDGYNTSCPQIMHFWKLVCQWRRGQHTPSIWSSSSYTEMVRTVVSVSLGNGHF